MIYKTYLRSILHWKKFSDNISKRGSPESVQVKFSAIEIKVQVSILLENFQQNFRLLMNDLSNLLERKNLWRGTIQITTEAENFDMNH